MRRPRLACLIVLTGIRFSTLYRRFFADRSCCLSNNLCRIFVWRGSKLCFQSTTLCFKIQDCKAFKNLPTPLYVCSATSIWQSIKLIENAKKIRGSGSYGSQYERIIIFRTYESGVYKNWQILAALMELFECIFAEHISSRWLWSLDKISTRSRQDVPILFTGSPKGSLLKSSAVVKTKSTDPNKSLIIIRGLSYYVSLVIGLLTQISNGSWCLSCSPADLQVILPGVFYLRSFWKTNKICEPDLWTKFIYE